MGRRICRSCIVMLVAGSAIWTISAGGSAAASERGHQARGLHKAKAVGPCAKPKSRASAKRGSCRRRQHRPTAPAVDDGTNGTAIAAKPLSVSDEPTRPPSDPPLEEEPPAKEDPPADPVIPRCEIVKGDCSIYSDKFWELQAKYERFEISTGVYPYAPACLEAWEAGRSIACATVLWVLYPDGTLGSGHWVLDPCAPGGWRLLGTEPAPCVTD